MKGFQWPLLIIFLFIFSIGWFIVGGRQPVHLYDADLNRLAANELEGYCSGKAFHASRGVGDPKVAAQCRQTADQATTTRPNRGSLTETDGLERVLPGFCRGIIVAGWEGSTIQCLTILTDNRMWPTYDGRLTVAFTAHYPWPGDVFPTAPTDDNERGPVRGNL